VCIAPGLRSATDLQLIIKTIGYLAIGVAILGALQFYLPSDHVLNQVVDRDGAPMIGFGTRVRSSGTFAFISGMGDFAIMTCWAGSCLLLASFRSVKGYVFILAGLTCALAALSR